MKPEQEISAAAVPMRKVGPLRLVGPEAAGDVLVPLATYERRCGRRSSAARG
jgi:hypothetical protein